MEQKVKNLMLEDKVMDNKINKIASFGTAAIVSAVIGGVAGYAGLNAQDNHIWNISTPIAFGGAAGMIYFSFKAAKNFKELVRSYK